MDSDEIFQKHRQIVLFAQLLRGSTLGERIRNLRWILELINSREGSWQPDELVILAEEGSPFLPSNELLAEISKLKLLTLNEESGRYELEASAELYERGLPQSIKPKDCSFSVAELLVLLQGGTALRVIWKRSTLVSILQSLVDFGFHCIGSWKSVVEEGKELDGVPFLWNVDERGNATPMGNLPASSATVDVLRLAIEPLSVTTSVLSSEQARLVEWAFDQVYRRIQFLPDGRAFYELAIDDSYPEAAHPINDTQSRVVHFLIQLLQSEQIRLDEKRREQAYSSAIALTRYLLSEQLAAPGQKYDGFWSFHKYDEGQLDGYQVLTINSELAMRALEGTWSIADDNLRKNISHSVDRLLTALRRTAISNDHSIGWQQHFSTKELEQSGTQQPPAPTKRSPELFATARGMLIFATATAMGLCEDGSEYIRGALRFLEETWIVNLRNVGDDVEFIPYRSPKLADWSDGTYRITNPISAIVPYYVLKTLRTANMPLPILISEPINNSLNFALANYEGHGFWRDAKTGSAYPTNTAFNMEMLIEYLRRSDINEV